MLSLAVEYGHLERNPAAGTRRRLRLPPRAPVHLETIDQIEALLTAARRLDEEEASPAKARLPIVGVLMLAGLARRGGMHTPLARRRPGGGGPAGRALEDPGGDPPGDPASPARRAARVSPGMRRPDTGPEASVFPSAAGTLARQGQPPLPRARPRPGRDRSGPPRGRAPAAAWSDHAPQAPPRLRLDPDGVWRGPDLGDGPAGPHRSTLHDKRTGQSPARCCRRRPVASRTAAAPSGSTMARTGPDDRIDALSRRLRARGAAARRS